MNTSLLIEFLKSKKPDASETTLDGYRSNLILLFKNLTNKDKHEFSMDVLNTYTVEEMVSCITNANKSKAYIRNMLSAVKAYTGDVTLTKLITNNSKEEKIDSLNPIANETIKKNHMTPEEIDFKYDELKNIAMPLFDKDNKDRTPHDFIHIQNYIVYCLVSGKFISPRRSSDWTKFKLGNIHLENDNYIDKHNFIFNQYKTCKYIGKQTIPIPDELYRILRKWVRYNDFEYLLLNKDYEPFNSSTYCKMLNSMMGEVNGNSTNNFRHIYLTNKFDNILDIAPIMRDMGSSENCANYYIKKV
jgi:integrase